MDFGKALAEIRAGEEVQRQCWRGDGYKIRLFGGGDFSAATVGVVDGLCVSVDPHIEFYIPVRGVWSPWAPTPGDLLANDWRTVPLPKDRAVKAKKRPGLVVPRWMVEDWTASAETTPGETTPKPASVMLAGAGLYTISRTLSELEHERQVSLTVSPRGTSWLLHVRDSDDLFIGGSLHEHSATASKTIHHLVQKYGAKNVYAVLSETFGQNDPETYKKNRYGDAGYDPAADKALFMFVAAAENGIPEFVTGDMKRCREVRHALAMLGIGPDIITRLDQLAQGGESRAA